MAEPVDAEGDAADDPADTRVSDSATGPTPKLRFAPDPAQERVIRAALPGLAYDEKFLHDLRATWKRVGRYPVPQLEAYVASLESRGRGPRLDTARAALAVRKAGFDYLHARELRIRETRGRVRAGTLVGSVLGGWKITEDLGRDPAKPNFGRFVRVSCPACGVDHPTPLCLTGLLQDHHNRRYPLATCLTPDCPRSRKVRARHKFAARRRKMIAEFAAGATTGDLAAAYGVTRARVSQIVLESLTPAQVRAWLASLPRGLLVRGVLSLDQAERWRVLYRALSDASGEAPEHPPPEIVDVDPDNPPEDPI